MTLCWIVLVGLLFQSPDGAPGDSNSNLDALLRGWEKRTAEMRSLRCEFRRKIRQQAYPDVIEEYGRAVYIRPNRGRMDLWRVQQRNGKRELVRSEIFICDGRNIHQYVFDAKEYIRHVLPPSEAGEQAARSALPFLFGMTAREARRRFDLRLYKESEKYAWLEIRPRAEQDKRQFRLVKVVLNKETYLPQAVLVVEPVGDQYLYEITRIEVNPEPPVSEEVVQPLRPPRDWQVYVNRLDQPAQAGPGNYPRRQ